MFASVSELENKAKDEVAKQTPFLKSVQNETLQLKRKIESMADAGLEDMEILVNQAVRKLKETSTSTPRKKAAKKKKKAGSKKKYIRSVGDSLTVLQKREIAIWLV